MNSMLRSIVAAPVVLVAALSACGGNSVSTQDPSASDGNIRPPPVSRTVSGVVVHGPVAGARVTFYVLQADGSVGTELGQVLTDAQGRFSAAADSSVPTILVEARGGTYTDPATGDVVRLTESDVVSSISVAGAGPTAVTALTHMAAVRTRALAAAGMPIEDAWAMARQAMAQQFGVSDPATTIPADPRIPNSAAIESKSYGALLGGLAKLASERGVRLADMVVALAADLSDGAFDGQDGLSLVTLPAIGGTAKLGTFAATLDLQPALDRFLLSSANTSGVTMIAILPVALHVDLSTLAAQAGKHRLTVSVRGTGTGRVYLSSHAPTNDFANPIHCPGVCSALLDSGDAATLAVSFGDKIRVEWSGDCVGTGETCQTTMNRDRTVVVTLTGPFAGAYAVFTNGTLFVPGAPSGTPVVDEMVETRLTADHARRVYLVQDGGEVVPSGFLLGADAFFARAAGRGFSDELGCTYQGQLDALLANVTGYDRGANRPRIALPADNVAVRGVGTYECTYSNGATERGSWDAYRAGP